MTQTYVELKAQIEKLQAQADALKEKEKSGVIERIKEAIEAFGFTAADLGLAKGKGGRGRPAAVAKKKRGRKAGAVAKAAPAVKYKDEAGNTWSGRGPRPAWLKAALEAGKTLENLAA